MLIDHYNGTSVIRSRLGNRTKHTSGILMSLNSLEILTWCDVLHHIRHETLFRILLGDMRVVRDRC